MNRQATHREIFTLHISVTEFVSIIYTELQQNNIKKNKHIIKKWAKDLETLKKIYTNGQ